MKYLNRIGFKKIISQNISHKRGDNAEYHLSDVIQLTVIGLIGSGFSMAKIQKSGLIVFREKLLAGQKHLLPQRLNEILKKLMMNKLVSLNQ